MAEGRSSLILTLTLIYGGDVSVIKLTWKEWVLFIYETM